MDRYKPRSSVFPSAKCLTLAAVSIAAAVLFVGNPSAGLAQFDDLPGPSADNDSAPAAVVIADEDPDLDGVLGTLPGKPPSPEQMAAMATLQRMLGAKPLQRRPELVVQALVERQKHPLAELAPPATQNTDRPGSPADPTQSHENASEEASVASPLAVRILSGDWVAVKKFLANLPQEQSSAAYGGLLSMLLSDATGVVLPQEIVALADASPGPLDDRHLAILGRLVRRGLQQSEKASDLVEALRGGTPHLGGEDPVRRIAAAKLLLAAGLPENAAAFLPPIDPAIADKDLATINLHARQQYLLGRRKNDSQATLRSWELTLAVLNIASGAEARAVPLRRALALAPRVPREVAGKWFGEIFRSDPAMELELLASVVQRVATSFQQQETDGRVNSMRLQHAVGTELVAARNGNPGDSAVALEMLTRGWINEAQKAAGGSLRKIVVPNDERIEALPVPALLETAPGQQWCKSVGADTADHILHLIGLLAARAGDHAASLDAVWEIVLRDPDLARQVAETLLLAVTGVNPDPNRDDAMTRYLRQLTPAQRRQYLQQVRQSRSQGMRGNGNEGGGQPITRAGQLRNLSRMDELLAAFKKAGVPPLSERVLVQGFASCHSPAEVYREEDIGRVFGPLDQLAPDSAFHLASSLREGLASAWRDPQVQQQQGTRRTPHEQAEEIHRGYKLAIELLTAAASRSPDRVDLLTMLGRVHFDQAEFLYGEQVDLATYVRERDTAFSTFQSAADAYARSVPTLDPEKYQVDVYQQWLQSALGSGELAYLTPQQPNEAHVQRIGKALSGLGPATSRHRQLFATALLESLDQVPSHVKPHLVRQAMQVLGDHPAARPLASRLAYYDDLLKEVELRLQIDGSDRVGRGRPFGVHVSLAGTRAVLRENDAFTSLLQSAVPGNAAYGQAADNSPRQRLEQELREKLSQAFSVETIAFHNQQSKPHSFGHEGWQELPVAYAILRTKDAAIDRLPSVQFDLEFADGGDTVRLPVKSQVVLLDSRDTAPASRPAREVKIRQLLDDRELDKGVLRLEVTATARGLVPELDQLLVLTPPVDGFKTARPIEQALNVTSLDAREALTERRWLLELSPAAVGTPSQFRFPAPADVRFAVTHQRYEDADIVDTTGDASLRWPPARIAQRWFWPALGAAGVLLCGTALVVVIVRRRRKTRSPVVAYRRPELLTPFTLLGLLQRIQHDTVIGLSPTERQDLTATIGQLEEQFFARGTFNGSSDLEVTLDRWLARARLQM